MAYGGYMGKILFVNLTDGTTETVLPEESFYRMHIGGYGLGVRVLYDRIRPDTDPFGPDNIIGFVTGAFVGTKSHSAGRFNVVFKSPLSGGWGDSSCGGHFGPKLKSTGYDAVFFSGVSPKPVFVILRDDELEIRDASHLCGKNSCETETILLDELGKDFGICCIGQAGEQKSKIAAVVHDQGRCAGRMGGGGVMGSKNLKAFAVKGTHTVSIVDDKAYRDTLDALKRGATIEKNYMFDVISKDGTSCVYVSNVAIQDAPAQNWRSLNSDVYPVENAEKIGAESLDPLKKKAYACAQCPVHCGAILETKDENARTYTSHRPEYETLACFGSLMLNDDLDVVMMANEKCNRYGFDTISAGGTIAFAMECFENGVISTEDTGFDLTWGNGAAALELLDLMAKREGIGAVFADGSRDAAEKLGERAEPFAMHTGGVEMAAHDPRCWPGFGYGYVLDATPGHHCQGPVGFIEHGWMDADINSILDITQLAETKYDYSGKGKPLATLNNWFHFFNGTGLCILGKYSYDRYPVLEMLRAVTGWQDFSMDEALEAGERINTLRNLFNIREGIIAHRDFALPKRIQGVPPFSEGPTAGITVDIDTARKDYYKEMDWDLETGMPSAEKLAKLGLKV